jgi:peroxiredoxin Q/BCP
MKELRVGAKAPKFELTDKDGAAVASAWAKNDFTVLYFYPKDSTPGCTLEAKEFSDSLAAFRARKASVIGVSGGDDRSKLKFCEKYALKVCLVSDSDFGVSQAYGVYGQKKFMGRTFNGIHRKTFVVDSRGVIAHVFSTVKPEGHADEVLRVIDQLRQPRAKKVVTATARRVMPKKKSPSAAAKTGSKTKSPAKSPSKTRSATKRTKR